MIDTDGLLHFGGVATSAYSFPPLAAGSFPLKQCHTRLTSLERLRSWYITIRLKNR